MSRSPSTFLALFLAGAVPAAGDWVGQRLCAEGLPRNGEFGSAVAIGEDGTIAVGDYLHDVVYLFRRTGAGCRQLPPIRGNNGEWFGFSVAIDQGILLVGAPKSGGTGAAYRIDLDGGTRQVLAVSPAQSGDEIGSAVAMHGDRFAIGARGADGRRGRVYIGSRTTLTAVPQPAGLASRAELGLSVALSDEWLVIGAPSPYRGSGPGAAYVLDLRAAGSSPVPLPLPNGLESEAAFGYGVAVEKDRILISAPLADAAGTDAGAVYRYQRAEGTWSPALLRTGGRGDQLGVSVALAGGTAVIGARYANATRGAAYLVGLASGSAQALQPREPIPNGAQFGFAVAIRSGTVVVGAFREAATGAAYDFLPAIHLDPIGEVPESSTTVTVTVRADQPVPRDVTVKISTMAGTAEEGAGGDYMAVLDQDVTLPAGATTATTVITLNPDESCEDEYKETFSVALFDPPGSEEAVQEVTATIVDDDPGDLILEPAPLRTTEDGSPVTLSVRLTCAPFAPVTVSLETIPSSVAAVSPAARTFTHKETQLVDVSGSDNADCGPAVEPYEIRATTASEDPRFAGLSRAILAENADDELACLSARMDVCVEGDGTVIYSIFLSNAVSASPMAPARLVDRLPDGLSVVTASASLGTATADPLAGSVHWSGPVPPEPDTVAITIVAASDVLPVPADLKNRASVTYPRDGRGTRQSFLITESVPVCP